MNKRFWSFLLVLCLMASLTVTTFAEHQDGGSDWSVTFTSNGKIKSKLPSIPEALSGLQPGDDVTFTIKVANEHKDKVDWYMMNTILKSLEDGTVASGGAYTYQLNYRTSSGQTKEIYNSETVGGEDPPDESVEGLHGVDSALKDYFYLESMPSGGSGVVTLNVALDGESQGNRYWDTQAKLRMRFAAELTKTNTVVSTGDETNSLPYIIGMGVSGLLILLLAIDGVRRRKKRGGESA